MHCLGSALPVIVGVDPRRHVIAGALCRELKLRAAMMHSAALYTMHRGQLLFQLLFALMILRALWPPAPCHNGHTVE